MSTLTEMMIVYALVAAAFLYVARGWIMKFVFKRDTFIDQKII